MADETTTQRHAELAAEHKRKSEWHQGLSEGKSTETPNAGSQVGGFLGGLAQYKWWIIGGAAAIIAFIVYSNQSSNNSSNTANTSPNLSSGGYIPSNISTSLDSINAAISGLSNQIAGQNNTTNTTTPVTSTTGSTANVPVSTTSNPAPVSLPPPQPPAPQPQYVSVQPWPATLSTLWGISQSQGISLARIESLNPQISNPNLIYPGQQVRVS